MKKAKKIALIAVSAVFIFGGCLSAERTQFTADADIAVLHNLMMQNGEVLLLTGDNGYQGIARYYSPDIEGFYTKLALIIFKDNTAAAYDMVSVPAASGAKFSDPEANFVFWEKAGEFGFYRGETLLATFTRIPPAL